METNNYFKKAPASNGYKIQVGCRVPQNVHDRLRDLQHSQRFTSFSAFIETVLTNYHNQQKTIEELENRLKTAGEVFEKGLTGLQNEAKETTELRYFFYNILMDALEIDVENRKQINAELLGDRDRENLIEIMTEAVPEFQQTQWEDSETLKTIEFSDDEISHINKIVNARVAAGASESIYHFFRQAIDFAINFSKEYPMIEKKHKIKFSVPEELPSFRLKNGFFDQE